LQTVIAAGGDARPTKFKLISLLTELWDFFAVRFYKDASPDGI
jgi:hypothetical protein